MPIVTPRAISIAAAETVGTYARLSFDAGYVFMNAIEEFHYFLVMPEPENGYNAALAHIDEYAKLFSLLADRCKLRLLSYICSCKESLLSVQSTAKRWALMKMKRLSCSNSSARLNGCCLRV